jgi:hypothetical protein
VCVVVVAGSCFPRFRGRQEFVMGSLWAHGGSTTFPWVPSRPVQLGYDRALRGAWGLLYQLQSGHGAAQLRPCSSSVLV